MTLLRDRPAEMGAHVSPGFHAVSPRLTARIAGGFYLLCSLSSVVEVSRLGGPRVTLTAGLASTVAYVGVTIFFYQLFKAVSGRLSSVALIVGLTGCLFRFAHSLHWQFFQFPSWPILGVYLILIGILILRSRFLPRLLGVLMAIAGLGALTSVSPQVFGLFFPANYIAAAIGEGALTVWLLTFGVNAPKWNEQIAEQGGARAHTVAADA